MTTGCSQQVENLLKTYHLIVTNITVMPMLLSTGLHGESHSTIKQFIGKWKVQVNMCTLGKIKKARSKHQNSCVQHSPSSG